VNEQAIYAATVQQVVRLARRAAAARDLLRGMAVWVAGRALAEGGNADRAAWAVLERQLHQALDALAAPAGPPAPDPDVTPRTAFYRQLYGGRTVSGPGGAGGDAPDGPVEPVEPLLEPVVIAIPAGLVEKGTAVRWWIEEEQRATEAYLFERADDIRRKLIAPFGLLYALEAQIGRLAALLTGAAGGSQGSGVRGQGSGGRGGWE
jgi:hypothetical protein